MTVTLKNAADRPIPKEADPDLLDATRVLAGEVAAFEGIVRRWQGPLVNMAWRYSRDRGRAEEMAQEAFIHAWRGLAHWRRESSFSTWLFALAANVYRTELKRFPTETLPLEFAPEPSRPAAQHQDLEEQRRHEVLRRAVLALPLRYREPMVLYYFQEMDVAAVSQTLRMPEGTLKARLSRARALLRQRFPQLKHLRCGQSPTARRDEDFASHPCEKNNNARVGHPQFSESEIAPTIGKEA